MRFRCVLQAIVASAVILLAEPVNAQSFFETLFGGSKTAASPVTARAPSRLLPHGGQAGVNSGNPYTAPPVTQQRREDLGDDQSPAAASDRGRTYRTVCVRMCDGFYWPVSFSASRSRFHRDANVCSSSCASEAKLFHFPAKGGQIDDAVDLTGRVYSRLPAAFKYRKALVPSCTCKPEPWSEAEADRHRNYAAKEDASKETPPVNTRKSAEMAVPPPSGPQPSVAVSDAKSGDQLPAALSSPTEAAITPAEAEIASPPRLRRTNQVRAPAQADAPARPAARSRQQAASPQPPQTQGASAGFWGAGQPSAFSWPGDAPVRVR